MDWNELGALEQLAVQWGVKVAGVLITLFLAWTISGWVRRIIVRAFDARSVDTTVSHFVGSIARWGILVGAAIGCLGVFGIETTSFAAVLASAGLAVGLAFQGTLSNFAAGVMLLIFRPFKAGDVVEIAGIRGTVVEIDLFTTELKTVDSRRVIVPNGSIFGSVITNLTHHPTRRVGIDVGVSYSASVDETREALMRAVANIPGVIEDPEPEAFLSGLGASSVDWQLRVWCKSEDYWAVSQAGIRAVKMELDRVGIEIPFPQMDLHLDEPVVQAIAVSK